MASPEEERTVTKHRKVGSGRNSPTAPPPPCSVTTNADFLYFGLSFIWKELPLEEPSNRIPLCELPREFETAIKDHFKRFKRGGFPITSNVGNTAFRRVEGTNIWIFQHATHGACSAMTFQQFHGALPMQRAKCGSCICLEVQPSHFRWEPFFYDNVSLERIYSERDADHPSVPVGEVVGDMLGHLRKVLQDPNNPSAASGEFSTGGAPLDVRGCMLGKDAWLTGCLKSFLPQNLKVEMTCKLGMTFTTLQMPYTGVPSDLCQCYPFHGAPDLTLKHFPIILGSDGAGAEEETESGSEPDCVIENSHQAPRLLPYPPKLGELLANMHVALVRKILRMFVLKGRREELSLASRGLLLHKAIGGIMCEMTVKLKKNEPAQLCICLDDFACGLLTPSSLCFHLQRLLKCDDIHQ